MYGGDAEHTGGTCACGTPPYGSFIRAAVILWHTPRSPICIVWCLRLTRTHPPRPQAGIFGTHFLGETPGRHRQAESPPEPPRASGPAAKVTAPQARSPGGQSLRQRPPRGAGRAARPAPLLAAGPCEREAPGPRGARRPGGAGKVSVRPPRPALPAPPGRPLRTALRPAATGPSPRPQGAEPRRAGPSPPPPAARSAPHRSLSWSSVPGSGCTTKWIEVMFRAAAATHPRRREASGQGPGTQWGRRGSGGGGSQPPPLPRGRWW